MDINKNPQVNMGPVNQGHFQNQNQNKNNFKKNNSYLGKDKFSRIGLSVLVFAVSIVLIGLLVFLAFGTKDTNEYKFVDSNKLQAVFLNTGQVYFGNIRAINSQYLDLVNIFYLQSSASSSKTNSNVTLVKLGCELHAPLDQMVINTSSVTFWENLSPNGQVSKAVATFWKQNPNGQKCSDQSTAGTSGQNTPQTTSNNNTAPTTGIKP